MKTGISVLTRSMALMAMLFIGVLPISVMAQSILEGRVTDQQGKPVEVAQIVVNKSLSTITDKNGRFAINGVPSGEVEYYVNCLGYKEQRGVVAIKGKRTQLDIRLSRLALNLAGVTVTAKQQAMGSKSLIDQQAVRHIQPKSVSDLMQLVPGSLTSNPSLNDLGQATVREISSNDNNAMGTAVIIDGTPISNDANLQAIAPTMHGKNSAPNATDMNNQTTAGRGADLRTISADNIESMEVIRGIPSVEYGNLTSGVVIVKTKSGRSPLEAKLKADPYSKLLWAGKGFSLGNGTMNVGLDWSQSYADTRRHYKGYDRITATMGYSTIWGQGSKRPVTFNLNGSFYSNVNNYKHDPQMTEMQLEYKNRNVGGRLSAHGHAQLAGAFLTGLDYDVSGQISRTVDDHRDYVPSPDGVISNSMVSGEFPAAILNKAYYSNYRIEGIPLNVFAQVKVNKYIKLGHKNDFTNVKAGVEYRLDDNRGEGLTFDMAAPPKAGSAQSYRPRSYQDIPALHNLSFFLSDVSKLKMGAGKSWQFDAGVRLSNLFLDKEKSGQSGIFVVEPRANTEFTFLTKENNNFFDQLSISGGFGISNKMPSLFYLYPDNAYFDNVSVSALGTDDSRLAVMTTTVVDNTVNPELKPARSTKWEIGLNARIGKMKGYVNFFKELHRNEFGYQSEFIPLTYTKYSIETGASQLAYNNGKVTYVDKDGNLKTAAWSKGYEIQTWGRPNNNQRSDKYGIEYSWDFGQWDAIKTSLVVDGAWFHIKRKNTKDYLSYVQYGYDYIPVMPAGTGTVSDRINSNFRFVTHIPVVSMVFTTTVQVVWYENTRSIYEDNDGNNLYTLSDDGTRYVVAPLYFYSANTKDKKTNWDPDFASDPRYKQMVHQYMLYAFKNDRVNPWALINFRFTKELGEHAEVSFMANNFLAMSKYHKNKYSTSMRQLYPDSYFGAELKLKF